MADACSAATPRSVRAFPAHERVRLGAAINIAAAAEYLRVSACDVQACVGYYAGFRESVDVYGAERVHHQPERRRAAVG